jgi:lysophospholipase L1-like esterase
MQKVTLHRSAIRLSCRSLLWIIFFILLSIAQSAHAKPVKIMPFGVWTEGIKHHVTYRYDLWFNLIDAGFDVDFVGSKRNGRDSPNLDLYPKYLTEFDRDHQGHGATFSDELIGVAKSASARHQPDIVLLWLGAYDILQQGAGGVVNTKFAIPDIIEGIRSFVPGVTILLGLTSQVQILEAEHVDALNDAIATIASELDTPQSPIILIDHVTGFDNASMMLSDGVHHSRVGEAWVAQNWFEVLADILPDIESFQINEGHSGAWFFPPTSGQGQFIDIEPVDQTMFLSWFTYTDAASANPSEQRWFTALGKYSGNTAVLDLHETLGGKFDDPQGITTTKIGEVTVSFNDCEQGQMSYDIPAENLQGSFPMQRVIPGSGNVCGQKSGVAIESVDINAGMDGSWFDPATSGQGFFIDSYPDPEGGNRIFVSWFTYGNSTASGLRWLTALGSFTGSVADIDVHETTGGSFDDPQPPTTTKVGTMSIDFTDCSNVQLSYSLPADPAAGDIAITRVIPGTQALCEELAGAN